MGVEDVGGEKRHRGLSFRANEKRAWKEARFGIVYAAQKLFIFTLSCSFRFLFTLDGRLLVMLSFADFSEHAGFSARSFESLKSVLERLVILYPDF